MDEGDFILKCKTSFTCLLFQVDEVADRYLVCSEHYKLLRDQIAQLRLSGDNQDLLQMIQVSFRQSYHEIM